MARQQGLKEGQVWANCFCIFSNCGEKKMVTKSHSTLDDSACFDVFLMYVSEKLWEEAL